MSNNTTLSYLTPGTRSPAQSRWGMTSLFFCLATLLTTPTALVLALRFGPYLWRPPLWLKAAGLAFAFSLLAAIVAGTVGILQREKSRTAAALGLIISTFFLLASLLWLTPLVRVVEF